MTLYTELAISDLVDVISNIPGFTYTHGGESYYEGDHQDFIYGNNKIQIRICDEKTSEHLAKESVKWTAAQKEKFRPGFAVEVYANNFSEEQIGQLLKQHLDPRHVIIKADPLFSEAYQYIAWGTGNHDSELLRFPNNGKSLTSQDEADIHRLYPNGTWRKEAPNSRFFSDYLSGLISPEDFINATQARALAEKWLSSKWANQTQT